MRIATLLIGITAITVGAQAQEVYTIKADSVKIANPCDSAELIIENHTQGVLGGFLYNTGNGRTIFKQLAAGDVPALPYINQGSTAMNQSFNLGTGTGTLATLKVTSAVDLGNALDINFRNVQNTVNIGGIALSSFNTLYLYNTSVGIDSAGDIRNTGNIILGTNGASINEMNASGLSVVPLLHLDKNDLLDILPNASTTTPALAADSSGGVFLPQLTSSVSPNATFVVYDSTASSAGSTGIVKGKLYKSAIKVSSIVSPGAIPVTISVGSGAASGTTVSLTSGSGRAAGLLSVTIPAGAASVAGGVLCEVTYGTAYPNFGSASITPANGSFATQINGVNGVGIVAGTGSFQIYIGSGNIPAGYTYSWYYVTNGQ